MQTLTGYGNSISLSNRPSSFSKTSLYLYSFLFPAHFVAISAPGHINIGIVCVFYTKTGKPFSSTTRPQTPFPPILTVLRSFFSAIFRSEGFKHRFTAPDLGQYKPGPILHRYVAVAGAPICNLVK